MKVVGMSCCGQFLQQKSSQLADAHFGPITPEHITNQTMTARIIIVCRDQSVADRWMLFQLALDLSRLDAKPRTFNCSSQRPRNSTPVGPVSTHISRLVETASSLFAVRVREKSLRCQVSMV